MSIKDELLSLESRKGELQARLNAPEMPELLHPRMADVYREKVGSLCSALESEERSPDTGDLLVQIKLVAGLATNIICSSGARQLE